MRLCTYERHGKIGVGVEAGGEVHATTDTDMLDLIRDGEAGLERARAAANGPAVTVDRMLAPLLRPGKTFGSGVNYKAHGEEEGTHAVLPVEPRIDFIKLPNTVIGPGEPIVIPTADRVIIRPDGYQVDYEVEFGVVIGKRAKNVSQADALDYVFGYTVFNDVGSRSLQFHNGQRDLGKNFDTFCPMGPCIVTKDELPDWQTIQIQSHVNGELRQSALAGEQIGPPAVAIEWISSIITLEPGDCLMTGTPAGCGTFMDPPRFLQPGDVVSVSASGVGELVNTVVQGRARAR